MSIFKRLFCKHERVVWLRLPPNVPEGEIVVPVRVCLECRKLTWATYCNNEYWFLDAKKDACLQISPPRVVKTTYVIQELAVKPADADGVEE